MNRLLAGFQPGPAAHSAEVSEDGIAALGGLGRPVLIEQEAEPPLKEVAERWGIVSAAAPALTAVRIKRKKMGQIALPLLTASLCKNSKGTGGRAGPAC